MREYVITLKNFDDLEEFYNDMETEGGNLYIPNRAVDVAQKRPISRNTHYMLTQEEADIISKDPRVSNVTLTASELGFKREPFYLTQQTSDRWSKSRFAAQNHLNWGLLRCYTGESVPNWGEGDGEVSYTSGTINLTSIGRNVDLVVIDGIINPSHPEFLLNHNGTGATRVKRYNWYQHNPEVLGTAASNYNYNGLFNDPNNLSGNNHGTHVAGTCAGSTQGWARAANIYNLFAYTNENIYDYVRAFHNSKPVNPATGRKNPTICNMSYGYNPIISNTDIKAINFRGSLFNRPSGGWQWGQIVRYKANSLIAAQSAETWGIGSRNRFTSVPERLNVSYRHIPDEVDIQDCINDGIIFVGAAGNSNIYLDQIDGPDYDNYMVLSNDSILYYNRGTTPGSADGVITVGSVGAFALEFKSSFSNYGAGIEIWAPGSNIMSSVISGAYAVNDVRNSAFKLDKLSGTSMASPQVCGVLACALENLPHMNQAEAKQYLLRHASYGQLLDSESPFSDTYLDNSFNRMLKYRGERKTENVIYPKTDYNFHKINKVIYPLIKIRRAG